MRVKCDSASDGSFFRSHASGQPMGTAAGHVGFCVGLGGLGVGLGTRHQTWLGYRGPFKTADSGWIWCYGFGAVKRARMP